MGSVGRVSLPVGLADIVEAGYPVGRARVDESDVRVRVRNEVTAVGQLGYLNVRAERDGYLTARLVTLTVVGRRRVVGDVGEVGHGAGCRCKVTPLNDYGFVTMLSYLDVLRAGRENYVADACDIECGQLSE